MDYIYLLALESVFRNFLSDYGIYLTHMQILDSIETALDTFFSNIYVNTTVKVFLVLYAALAAPRLPKVAYDLFQNVIFRIVVAFLIILLATRDAGMALLVAIAFVITLYSAARYQLIDPSLSSSINGELSWLPSTKDEQSRLNTKQLVPHSPIANVEIKQQSANEKFTTQQSSELLGSAGLNEIPNADQKSCPRTWESQHCIQGIETEQPSGFDMKDNYSTY
jgi:hypothetical protein